MFSKNYFVSGKFLEDWVDLKEQGKVLIDYYMFHDMFIFDTVDNKAYSIDAKPCLYKIRSHSIEYDTTWQWFGYALQNDFEDNCYIGKLFKDNIIDFAFCYPTFVDFEDPRHPYIAWNLGYCFAKKGNRFFYIDSVEKNIYPMEEVVEDHWEWITNVVEKQ